MAVLRPRLQHHRDDDQRDAEDKREVQLVVFLENQHREDDAINGLQIVGEVDRESVNLLQDNDLQQTESDGANHHHKGHIGIVHTHRKELPDRQ